LRQLAKREKREPSAVTQKLVKLDTQADALRALLKTGAISPTIAQAGLDTIDRERAELLSTVARRERKNGAEIIRVIPQSAQLYREAVRNLNMTLTETADRQEARALVAELLGGQVKVRQQGGAVYARLELDAGVLLAAAGDSNRIRDFQIGSGGSILNWKSLKTKEIRIC